MKISVITLTYNNYEELVQTLNSVPRSSFIESVIVNGGTDPQTAEYLRNYSGIVVSGKDEGIADAFNKGVRASTGDAVLFLNSGDILINPDYLSTAADALKDGNVNFVHSNLLYNHVGAGNLVIKPTIKNPGRGMLYLHPTMIAKKELFNKIGFFNTNYKIAMDYDWIIRLEKNGYKGKYLDLSPVIKMNGEGISVTKEFSAILECYRSLKENKFLTLNNIAGFTTRLTLYYLRRLTKLFAGERGIRKLKEQKYSKPA